MRYLSVCSGIEAATVAWHPLGWTPVGFAEIDPFACAVLAERFGANLPGQPPSRNGVPNFGDFTAIDLAQLGPVDLLVGGTPCQAFSFAGKRLSLADARGNLTLAYAVLAHELARSHGLRNALWENVPGVLSTEDNAFGCFLGALVGSDSAVDLPKGVERWPDAGMVSGPRARAAWRLLDAQYFGLAQRRERVFVVVDFGNGADPAAVLFESQGVSGNSPPRREAGERVAGTVAARTQGGGGLGTDFECDGGLVPATDTFSADDYQSGSFEKTDVARPLTTSADHTRAAPIVAFGGNNCVGPIDIATALTAHGGPAGRCDFESETFIAAFAQNQRDEVREMEVAGSLAAEPGAKQQTYIAFTCKDYGGDAQEDLSPTLRAGGFTESHANAGVMPAIAFAFQPRFARNDRGAPQEEIAYPLTAEAGRTGKGDSAQCVAFQSSQSGVRIDDVHATLDSNNGSRRHNGIVQGWAVRRLTTVECARLQGFPDHHSRIPWRGKPAAECPDGPQYKTYGNSMAVKCMRWLGERIALAMGSKP